MSNTNDHMPAIVRTVFTCTNCMFFSLDTDADISTRPTPALAQHQHTRPNNESPKKSRPENETSSKRQHQTSKNTNIKCFTASVLMKK
jgi:hypothetical protein